MNIMVNKVRMKELRRYIEAIRIERKKLLDEQREYRIELDKLRRRI